MIETKNPFTNKNLKSYKFHTDEKLKQILKASEDRFKSWKQISLINRIERLDSLANVLNENLDEYSILITNEMGKPIVESRAEIKKCIYLCEFYSKNAELLLSDVLIETEANESFISYDPLGTILAIMPWNYPFWQVFRFAVPTLTAGNTVLLKHATNVTGCALAIEKIFEDAGYPKNCFQTLLVEHEQIESVIKNDTIKAVSLTGSEKAGSVIASIAGKHLKKTVLELGGNNACIVLADANLDKYLETMVKARMQNTGQSCIAAKRFIVVESIYDEFLEKLTSKVNQLKYGNPIDETTDIGVLAREDLANTLKNQIEKSIKLGAHVHVGNKQDKAYYELTILTNVSPGMPVFDEETFGPVASIIKAKNESEAYKLATTSRYGLGTMVFTENIDAAVKHISKIEDGAFFINELVKSDPRLPFGGTKASGYGRELSKEGLMEFVNKKTIYINN